MLMVSAYTMVLLMIPAVAGAPTITPEQREAIIAGQDVTRYGSKQSIVFILTALSDASTTDADLCAP